MSERLLRELSPSFVVAAPAGVRVRTRLRPLPAEADALTAIGEHLGALYRATLVQRLRVGRVDAKAKGEWRREAKRELTAATSSRWAGALTRSVKDQYQLGMRGLAAEVSMLRSATSTIRGRLAVEPGGKSGRVAGYRSTGERHAKSRRLEHLTTRLDAAETALAAARPSLTVGSGRLWATRQHLDDAHLTVEQWNAQWDASRVFMTADGEATKRYGNETIRIAPSGLVTIKTPAALADALGSHITLTAPVAFNHRGDEWADRVMGNQAVRYDISFDPDKGRWYIDASWAYPKPTAVPLEALQAGRVLGVDLNADHLAAHVLDSSGNPTGAPLTVPLVVAGLPASTRSARVRDAISELLRLARTHGCKAIAIENLNFDDARTTGRETMGRGQRGKKFRRTVAGIPTAQFRDQLAGMAATQDIHVIAVDPAYTSKWGDQHWRSAVTSSDRDATRHHAASVAIGRRALGHPIRRKASGPRRGQRTTLSTPTPRRRAPEIRTAERKGTGGHSTMSPVGHPKTPRAHAPKTVRGATAQQESLLLTV